MLEPFTPTFFRQLQQLQIHTRRTFLGSRQGSHLSNRRGHGLEFADYRLYSSGDDFRHIDWGILGRTDRLYVRQFRDEQNLNVMFLLDASRSMAFPEDENKFDVARDIALSLSFVALSGGDTVTLSMLGHRNTPRYNGTRAIYRAIKALREVEPSGTIDFLTEVRAAVARQKLPGKCFFISDFLFPTEEQFATLDYLRSRNFEIVVLQVLAPSELSLKVDSGDTTIVDAETGEAVDVQLNAASRSEYAKLLAAHIEQLEKYCERAGIPHVLISSREGVREIVLKRLPELGLLK